MTATISERLAELLPAVYRIRDEEQGRPLAELLEVVGDQAAVLEESLRQLYDDQFVETCAPWVLPYIGDLLGVAGLPGEPLSPRAEVAHTIAYRRRKGTAAVLEQLARDVAGLPARADESFELLAATQHVNHRRLERPSFLAIGDAARLEHLGGPFERLPEVPVLSHTVDVRRIASGRGRYNIPNVAIFLWRLRALRLTRSPVVPATPQNRRRFRFSPLGHDAPLFSHPETEDVLTHLSEPLNVPAPITRRAFHGAPGEYYGDDRSVLLERPGPTRDVDPVRIPTSDVIVCDLSDWTPPPAGKVAVDPVLGRIQFEANEPRPPLATFHLGFPGPLGGGEYARALAGGPPARRVAATHDDDAPFSTIQDAIDDLPAEGGVVEIADSGRYEETLTIAPAGGSVVVRAGAGRRPSIVLGGQLHLSGGAGDAVTLDGLLLSGAGLEVDAGPDGEGLGRLELRHCTLVPGLTLGEDGIPASPGAPSVVVHSSNTALVVESSITGALRASIDARVRIGSGIVDAGNDANAAYGDTAGTGFGAPLSIEETTIVGRVRTDLLELGSNSLFLGRVVARRRQEGCARFSYLTPGSLTPPRYRCQPASGPEATRVRPMLTSTRYGDPGYCQLGVGGAPEIERGADDESELGAFHDLFLPQREAHLRARLVEYLRFGLEAGIFYAT